MSQSDNFTVLFNWGWSCLINKISLIRSLNLFASEARISKWSKFIKQLHSSRWSNTADCLRLLRRFPVKLEIPMCSAVLVKKWLHVVAELSLHGDQKITLTLQNFKLFSIELTERILSWNDFFPIKWRTQTICFLEVFSPFSVKALSEYFF